MKLRPFTAAISLGFAAAIASSALAAEPVSADELLRQMSAKLGAAQRLSFTAQRTSSAGHANLEVAVLRPDKIAAKSTSRGDVRHFIADGRTFTLLDVTQNFYATVPMRTSIDGLAAQLDERFGFTPPLVELARSDVYADINHQTRTVTELGRGYLPGGFLGMGGTACRRLALAGKAVDAELWIAVSDQLPRKLIATVKSRAGQRIVVEFSDWNLAAKLSAQDFVFTPPKGARRIPMLTTAELASSKKAAPKKK